MVQTQVSSNNVFRIRSLWTADVIHGRTIACAHFMIILGAFSMIGEYLLTGLQALTHSPGTTIYLTYYEPEFFNLASAAVEALDVKTEWELLLYLPVAFGSIIIFFSAISIAFSLLSVKQALEFEEMVSNMKCLLSNTVSDVESVG